MRTLKHSTRLKHLLFALFTIYGKFLAGQPVITSFSPVSAPPGSAVVIRGANFNTVALGNIVYFGAVKGTVTSAAADSVNVRVPFGASYDLITLTSGNLTAYSAKKFLPATGSGIVINPYFFAAGQDYLAGAYVFSAAVADFTSDGRADVVTANYSDGTISVFRNTSFAGTIALAPKVNFSTPANPGDVRTGDVNGDGKPDIITISDIPKIVSVFLNTSPGGNVSFAARQDFPAGANGVAVAIGDIDGDGKTDLVEINNQDNTVSVLRNTSTSTVLSFAARVSFPTAVAPIKVIVSDMDDDGKQDIVVSNLFSRSVSVFKNLSVPQTISLATKVDFPVNGQARQVDIGDFNNDNKPDIVVGSNGDSISVLTNTSSGAVFSFDRQDIAIGTSPVSVAIHDIDGDGKPDISVAGSVVNIFILQNTSSGGITSFAPKVAFPMPGSSELVLPADLDNDGKTDLIVGRFSQVTIMRNRKFEPVLASFSPATGPKGTTVTIRGQNLTSVTLVKFGTTAAASFSVLNDSTINAVVANGNSGQVSAMNSNGTGTSANDFTYTILPPLILSVTPASGPAGTVVTITGKYFGATINTNIVRFGAVLAPVQTANDTMLTVTVPAGATYEPPSVSFAGLTGYAAKPFNTTFAGADSSFSANTYGDKTDSITGVNPFAAGLGDFDQDGRTDIVVSNFGPGNISVFRNVSDSARISLAAKKNFVSGNGPGNVAIADLDGDGKLDIAVANMNSNTISVFRNTGSNSISFAAKADLTTLAAPVTLKVTDLNSDGKPDIAVITSTGILSVYANSSFPGFMAFGRNTDSLVDSHPIDFAVADLDGDGKPDLAVVDSASGNLVLYRNITTGFRAAFAPRVTINAGNSRAITAADMDGDGKPDLVLTSYTGNNISVYKNQGQPGSLSFSVQQYPAAAPGTFISVADTDGDGRPDIGTANNGSGNVSLFRNSWPSLPGVKAPVQFATGNDPRCIAFADLDRDSKPEMVITNYLSNTLSILRNQTGEAVNIIMCPGGSSSFASNIPGLAGQWEADTGTGYIIITDNANYSGTNTPVLSLTGIPSSFYGYRYRCKVAGVYSDEYALKFRNIRSASGNWEDAASWSCGTVPDANTDVIITSGNIAIHSNVTIRSLTTIPGTQVTIASGFTLTVIH